MKTRQICTNRILGAALALAVLLGSLTAWANSTPFSRLYVFGDSLSDSGRFYELTGGFPESPYWLGRYSNGRVWVEHVAEFLRMPLVPENNYAVAGAATGELNFRNGFWGQVYPGVSDQLDWFLEDPPADIADALFIYWAEANDVFIMLATGGKPEDMIRNGVMNTVQAVQALYLSGARHIVVVNMTDLGLTPFAAAYNISAQMTALSMAYNNALSSALDMLETAGIHTIRIDAFEILNAMASNPDRYGFINTTEPGILSGGNGEGYLFWDEAHPTAAAHEVMASEAVIAIIKEYSPRQSHKIPLRSAASLDGLVK